MEFESKKHLLSTIINEPELADVKFVVGEKEKEIYAHKVILAASSSLYRKMFFPKNWRSLPRSLTELFVPTIEPFIFRTVLNYIYTQKVDLTSKNVVSVLSTSEQLQIYGLKEMCKRYLVENLTLANCLSTLEQAKQLNDPEVQKEALAFFEENSDELLRIKGIFNFLKESTIELVLKNSNLMIPEIELFRRIRERGKWLSQHDPNDKKIFLKNNPTHKHDTRKDCTKEENYKRKENGKEKQKQKQNQKQIAQEQRREQQQKQRKEKEKERGLGKEGGKGKGKGKDLKIKNRNSSEQNMKEKNRKKIRVSKQAYGKKKKKKSCKVAKSTLDQKDSVRVDPKKVAEKVKNLLPLLKLEYVGLEGLREIGRSNLISLETIIKRTSKICKKLSSIRGKEFEKYRRNKKSLKVLLLASHSSMKRINQVIESIKSKGIRKVEFINVHDRTPTFQEIKNFDSIFVFSYNNFQDSVVIGDLLAKFVESGKGVVICSVNSLILGYKNEIKGRILDFLPIGKGKAIVNKRSKIGKIFYPNHPIMKNVKSFDGGICSFHIQSNLTKSINDDELLLVIANYDDGNALITLRQKKPWFGVLVVLNFLPISDKKGEDFFLPSTDGDKIIANSVKFVSYY
ncbi:btb/poz domain-containing protein [Anaeramoeba flamelloides]|uniref:Btb/poz domain-containing protein n=1 Tax=Anaeramoeba flamelloides TaxID=1746091 RepID=A0ABQ8Y4T6_9EUKA|nr:btb/poz domain-containing protein [Anaeramoeba flamelloides]